MSDVDDVAEATRAEEDHRLAYEQQKREQGLPSAYDLAAGEISADEIAEYCMDCPLVFESVEWANVHHESTGHHQSPDPAQSFEARRARDGK